MNNKNIENKDENNINFQYHPYSVEMNTSSNLANNSNVLINDPKVLSIVEQFKNALRDSGLKKQNPSSHSSNQKSNSNSPVNYQKIDMDYTPIIELNKLNMDAAFKPLISHSNSNVETVNQFLVKDNQMKQEQIERQKVQIECLLQQIESEKEQLKSEKENIDELNLQIMKLKEFNQKYIAENGILIQQLSKSDLLNNQKNQIIENSEKSILQLNTRINELENQLKSINDEHSQYLDLYKKKLIDDEFQQLVELYLNEKAQLHNENKILRSELEEERRKQIHYESNIIQNEATYQNTSLINFFKEQLKEQQSKYLFYFQNKFIYYFIYHLFVCLDGWKISFLFFLFKQVNEILQQVIQIYNARYQNFESVSLRAIQLDEENRILRQEVQRRFDETKRDLEYMKMQQVLNKKDLDIDELQKSLIYLHGQLQQNENEAKNNISDQMIETIKALQNKVEDYEKQIQDLSQALISLDQKCKSKEIQLIQCQQQLDEMIHNSIQIKDDKTTMRMYKGNVHDDQIKQFQKPSDQSKLQIRINMSNSVDFVK